MLFVSILDLSSVVTTIETTKMILNGLIYTVLCIKEGNKPLPRRHKGHTPAGALLFVEDFWGREDTDSGQTHYQMG